MKQNSGTNAPLNSVYFVDSLTGWIAGLGGTILKTTTGGVFINEKPEEELPQSFSLSQNYPNPFNPSTVVNYSLPEGGVVCMKLYNIQGREVATLLNEFKAAGNHSISIDAAKYGLSSGVYFYRMTSGSNSAITKKMILIR
ncbi:MAG: T9SS type A sorting domain-containing protein [Bacteroidetes bacterium]|nr:T9SS type A sorting domain-containing protein [Bacteroidota bacterium]